MRQMGHMGVILPVLTCILASWTAFAGFDLADKDGKLTVMENGKPVLVYNYARVAPPPGVPERYGRECYIHPLYDLNGNVMTNDFPVDHYHHRGVFWAWPECKAGDRRLDVWEMKDARQHHEKWLEKKAEPDKAILRVQNFWSFDDAPQKAIVQEEVGMTVRPANANGRAIDFDLKMTNVSDGDVSFLGAKNKGYGGLCFRPAKRLPFTFTTEKGVCAKDALRFDTAWADISFNVGRDSISTYSGVAIIQDPKNPGYPFPGWIFRHYGFLGASWPHEQSHVLKPGESFELRYRMYVHQGKFDPKEAAK